MPREATGELRRTSKGFECRVRLAGRERIPLELPHARNEYEARERMTALATMAKRLLAAGAAERTKELLELAAAARPGAPWAAVVGAVDEIASGIAVRDERRIPTVKDFAEDWTGGRLAKRFPDHVRAKRSSGDDERNLRLYVLPHLGALPIDLVTLEHVDDVMAKLPERLSSASRRHVAQVLHRLLAMAVYPARHRKTNPIPSGWMPRIRSDAAKTFLYPDEDAKLLACVDVPIERRIFYGFLSREGMRRDEAYRLTWRDVDLERGMVHLDENKTDEPRSWALDPGTRAALTAWKKSRGNPPASEHVFERDGALDSKKLSQTLRADLRAAGVDREHIFATGGNRLPLRVHDLRATFVTLNLAAGKSETWVTDRTGHKSSAMVARYKRKARQWSEAALGVLSPLDRAIPELAAKDDAPSGGAGGGGGAPGRRTDGARVPTAASSASPSRPIAPGIAPEAVKVGAASAAKLAEREGFEPSVPLRAHMISNHAPSTTRSSLPGKRPVL